jgi:hypothetical protein
MNTKTTVFLRVFAPNWYLFRGANHKDSKTR